MFILLRVFIPQQKLKKFIVCICLYIWLTLCFRLTQHNSRVYMHVCIHDILFNLCFPRCVCAYTNTWATTPYLQPSLFYPHTSKVVFLLLAYIKPFQAPEASAGKLPSWSWDGLSFLFHVNSLACVEGFIYFFCFNKIWGFPYLQGIKAM